jgi:hypothetical protein
MPDDRPMFYESSSEFQEFTLEFGNALREEVLSAVQQMGASGSDNNERMSALAHWTALIASVAVMTQEARLVLGLAPLGTEAARGDLSATIVDIFLADVRRRTLEAVGAARSPTN